MAFRFEKSFVRDFRKVKEKPGKRNPCC